MPIEFYCPGCGNLMRTPDETAGRKGRCPTCQLKVQIPASSVTSATAESTLRRSSVATKAKPSGNEPLRIVCGRCGKVLRIAAANAGKKGKCPHCGELMSIPLNSPAPGERWKGTPKHRARTSPAVAPKPASTPPPSPIQAGGEKIAFPCSNCREVVRVGASAAGKKGQCPRCQAIIQIPLQSTNTSGLRPIPNEPPSPGPRRKSVAPTFELTPLPSGSFASGGLTPLEPLGQTPLEPAHSGTAGDFDPLGLETLAPAAFQSYAQNPFAAPNPIGATRPTGVAKRPRTGLHTATTVCASLMIALAVIQMVWIPISVASDIANGPESSRLERMPEENRSAALAFYEIGKKFAYVLVGCAELIYLTILAGAIQMLRFKTWGLGMAASILCMTPCGCLCFVGVPLGIWGIVMLSQGPVRETFS